VAAVGDPHSLGYGYGAVTVHLGWRRGDEEGTVMALAALGDAGTAVGAAAAAHLDHTGALPEGTQGRCYLGPAYPDDTPPARPRPGLTARRVEQPAVFLAERLAAGRIFGVCCLINTSLNVKGKRICGTPQMALDCLAESGLDGCCWTAAGG